MPFNGFLGPLSEQSAPTRILRRRYSFVNDYTTLLRDSQVLCVYFLYLYIKANLRGQPPAAQKPIIALRTAQKPSHTADCAMRSGHIYPPHRQKRIPPRSHRR